MGNQRKKKRERKRNKQNLSVKGGGLRGARTEPIPTIVKYAIFFA
jgi:hypothetical protein